MRMGGEDQGAIGGGKQSPRDGGPEWPDALSHRDSVLLRRRTCTPYLILSEGFAPLFFNKPTLHHFFPL